eukprot:s532_g13.t1
MLKVVKVTPAQAKAKVREEGAEEEAATEGGGEEGQAKERIGQRCQNVLMKEWMVRIQKQRKAIRGFQVARALRLRWKQRIQRRTVMKKMRRQVRERIMKEMRQRKVKMQKRRQVGRKMMQRRKKMLAQLDHQNVPAEDEDDAAKVAPEAPHPKVSEEHGALNSKRRKKERVAQKEVEEEKADTECGKGNSEKPRRRIRRKSSASFKAGGEGCEGQMDKNDQEVARHRKGNKVEVEKDESEKADKKKEDAKQEHDAGNGKKSGNGEGKETGSRPRRKPAASKNTREMPEQDAELKSKAKERTSSNKDDANKGAKPTDLDAHPKSTAAGRGKKTKVQEEASAGSKASRSSNDTKEAPAKRSRKDAEGKEDDEHPKDEAVPVIETTSRKSKAKAKAAPKKGHDGDKGEGPKKATCFARRYCPNSEGYQRAKWLALREAFESQIKPSLETYSKHEDSKTGSVRGGEFGNHVASIA